MTTLSDSAPQTMRGPWTFMGSVLLHCWVLAWIAMGPSLSSEHRKSLYEREIQSNDKKIVWYKLSEKLPNVTPAQAREAARPPRAKTRFEQNIAVGPKDKARPPQMILAPAPEITPAKPLPLPNIVALAAPRPRLMRPYIPPPDKTPAPADASTLPDAPKLHTSADAKPLALDLKRPRLERKFVPPPTPKRSLPAGPAALPDAPKLTTSAESKPLAIDLKAPLLKRKFTPSSVPKQILPAEPARLPPAPEMAAASSLAVGSAPLPPQKFVPPPLTPAPRAAPVALAAPPPMLTAAGAMADNSLVIAGLDPTKSVEVPAPPGSVKAGFSGGAKVQPKGGDGGTPDAAVEIPSLTVQGGAKNPQPPIMVAHVSPTSPEALAAALRGVHSAPLPAGGVVNRSAARVTNAPDPRLYGRQVYSMAIQIPSLTSKSGSWLVWFASREADIGNAAVDMKPPLPVDMVSPRYVASAADEHVEGKVRLWAVIGKDGHVTDVSLLQHLDDRLDRSAQDALRKWRFQPALRNGSPIDVDAVFEVPFYLTARTVR